MLFLVVYVFLSFLKIFNFEERKKRKSLILTKSQENCQKSHLYLNGSMFMSTKRDQLAPQILTMKSPRKLSLLFSRHWNPGSPWALKSSPSLPACSLLSVWSGASVIWTWGLGGLEAQEIRPSSLPLAFCSAPSYSGLLLSIFIPSPHPLSSVRPVLSFSRWTAHPGFQPRICLHGDGSEMQPRRQDLHPDLASHPQTPQSSLLGSCVWQ